MMRGILSRAQKYVQIGNATRSSANRFPKRGSEGRNKKRNLFPRRRLQARQSEQSTSPFGTVPRSTEMKPTSLLQGPYGPGLQSHQGPGVCQAPEATPVEPERTESRRVLCLPRQYGHRIVDCSLRRQLQELVNREYLQEFILNTGQPSEARVQKLSLIHI